MMVSQSDYFSRLNFIVLLSIKKPLSHNLSFHFDFLLPSFRLRAYQITKTSNLADFLSMLKHFSYFKLPKHDVDPNNNYYY